MPYECSKRRGVDRELDRARSLDGIRDILCLLGKIHAVVALSRPDRLSRAPSQHNKHIDFLRL